MPYKNADIRRERQREIMRKWRIANREKADKQAKESYDRRVHHNRDSRAERKFRFLWIQRRLDDMSPIMADMQESSLTITGNRHIESPEFYFEYKGRRVKESLLEPLPEWTI